MIDPKISLAYSVYSNKGIFALLLGSGLSKSAEIPTGWDITLDLVRKIAAIEGEEITTTPEDWYQSKYGEAPDYSILMNELAKGQVARQQTLQTYIEPTQDEFDDGKKLPTKAHHAIASLVRDGYIKVIVTTNFDQLLEQALNQAGVSPTVISSPDHLNGAMPLVHSDCTIIKIHGDYKDTGIKNTLKELEEYSDGENNLLDRIFAEYSLIVCGWSGEWDIALRKALLRCNNRRFSTYWMKIGEPNEKAMELIRHRGAELISIAGADEIFTELEENVQALERVDAQHPLTADIAVARLKKYIAKNDVIGIYDLFVQETNSLVNVFDSKNALQFEPIEDSLAYLDEQALILQKLLITVCFWANKDTCQKVFRQCMTILHNAERKEKYLVHGYAVVLLLYIGGIAAIAAGKYDVFYSLVTEAKNRTESQKDTFAAYTLTLDYYRDGHPQPRNTRHLRPMAQFFNSKAHLILKDLIPVDAEFQYYFDMFEYLFYWILREEHLKYAPNSDMDWGGLFMIRERVSKHVWIVVDEQINRQGDDYPLLKAGFMDGYLLDIVGAKKHYDEKISNFRRRNGID